MRKHRLYGIVLAVLTATGVTVQQIGQAHATANSNDHTNAPTDRSAPWNAPSMPPILTSSVAFHPTTPPPLLIGAVNDVRFFAPGTASDRTLIEDQREEERQVHAEQVAAYVAAVQLKEWVNAVEFNKYVATVVLQQYAAAVAAQQAAAQQAAQQEAAQQAAAQQAAAAASATAGGVWAALRACESGGDYSEDTGNGYYGAYQFSLPTWESLGYSGLPSDASPAEQDAAAQQLQARSGWGQWPVCSANLGLT